MTEESGVDWRLLSLHIIKRALQDVVRPTCCHESQVNAAQQSAKEFLFSKEEREDLRMFTDLAGLRFEVVQERAREIFDKQIDISELEAKLKKEIQLDAADDDEVEH